MSSFHSSGPPKSDEADKALAKILELGQGDIEDGNFRDINEFFAELDSEQHDVDTRGDLLDDLMDGQHASE
ncbi:hypothetical protein BJG93_35360 [Paraburkholderia sprentiae WSM5005]|uniref:Uncharacterized protein n=1 Tax=Paraburkholderia sprentiae WSM5005 TaxID=754502 RepID=A0A8F4KIT3_9BURK|nr:hypothetical protein [Paraburkholderia sprentiae]QXE07136.1 hypothetical protein BJG93_35360 [Paraburkholderia sprentiae WSM5005]